VIKSHGHFFVIAYFVGVSVYLYLFSKRTGIVPIEIE